MLCELVRSIRYLDSEACPDYRNVNKYVRGKEERLVIAKLNMSTEKHPTAYYS